MDRNLTVNEQYELRILERVQEHDKITQRGAATELEIVRKFRLILRLK